MTPFEFNSALDGWAKVNGAGEKSGAPSDEEFEQAVMRARDNASD